MQVPHYERCWSPEGGGQNSNLFSGSLNTQALPLFLIPSHCGYYKQFDMLL